jgi:hypothetical protein
MNKEIPTAAATTLLNNNYSIKLISSVTHYGVDSDIDTFEK